MYTEPTLYPSPKYIDLYVKVFKDVYRIEQETDDLLNETLCLEYERLYGLSNPTPPREDHEIYLTIAKLIHLHEIAMKQTENPDIVGKIRNRMSAYNPLHPIIHVPPEHVEVLLNSVVVQELEVVVRRYVFPRRPWSPYDTKLKLKNYIISDK